MVQVSAAGVLLLPHPLRVAYITLLISAFQTSSLVCAVLTIPLRQLTHTRVLPFPPSSRFLSAIDTFSHSGSPSALTFFCPSPFVSLCLLSRAGSLSGRAVSRSSRSILSCTNVELLRIHKVTDSSGLLDEAFLLPGRRPRGSGRLPRQRLCSGQNRIPHQQILFGSNLFPCQRGRNGSPVVSYNFRILVLHFQPYSSGS